MLRDDEKQYLLTSGYNHRSIVSVFNIFMLLGTIMLFHNLSTSHTVCQFVTYSNVSKINFLTAFQCISYVQCSFNFGAWAWAESIVVFLNIKCSLYLLLCMYYKFVTSGHMLWSNSVLVSQGLFWPDLWSKIVLLFPHNAIMEPIFWLMKMFEL